MRTYKSIIECSDEDELPIGGELGKGDGRFYILDQRLQQRPILRVPNLAGTIMAARDNERPIPIEVNRRDRHGMSPNHIQALPSLDLPDANSLIKGP